MRSKCKKIIDNQDLIFSNASELLDDFIRANYSGKQIDTINSIMTILSSWTIILKHE